MLTSTRSSTLPCPTSSPFSPSALSFESAVLVRHSHNDLRALLPTVRSCLSRSPPPVAGTLRWTLLAPLSTPAGAHL